MSMTPRGQNFPTPPRPLVATVGQKYEDFRPATEWKQDEQSNNLVLIYLPDFQRKHLKVSIEGRNILRARGEQLVAGNIWSRFQEDFPLPEDCNVGGIRAKFEGRILTIIIPKKREAAKATEESDKPSQRTREDHFPRKQTSPPKAAMEKTHKEASNDAKKERNEEARESPPLQKLLPEKPEMKIFEKRIFLSDDAFKMSLAASLAAPLEQLDKHILRENKGKLKSQKDHGKMQPKEKKTTTTSAASSSTGLGPANYKQAVENFTGMKEQRQLLVNVGVALLVIVAFGAYLSFTFQGKQRYV